MTDQHNTTNNEIDEMTKEVLAINSKIPIAVVILLVTNLVAGIWFSSAFYTQQKEQNLATEKGFVSINQQIVDIEKSIYTRQEATIALEGIRQTNDRQDADIKQLNVLFTNMLMSIGRPKR